MTKNQNTKRLIRTFDQIRSRYESAAKKLSFEKFNGFDEWRPIFFEKVKELVGRFPEPVPLNWEVLEEEIIDDFIDSDASIPYIQQKIVFDSEAHASVIAYLLIPGDIKNGEKRAAILNAHGHGSGKAMMVGLDPNCYNQGEDMPTVEASSVHLVKNGYVVLAPDWRPFGERRLDDDYARKNRDPCNVAHMGFGYFGYNLLALNIWDAIRSIDLLCELPFVDDGKIGMVGKSYGGTITLYTTIFDNRIKVSVISGYLSTLNDALSMRACGNYCGAQYLQGILEFGDIPDLFGLIAPRPLLIESGLKDDCFIYSDADNAFKYLEKIYESCNASENLERDVADVGHNHIFEKIYPFLKKHLAT